MVQLYTRAGSDAALSQAVTAISETAAAAQVAAASADARVAAVEDRLASGTYTTATDLARAVRAAAAADSPFEAGRRYISPVSYWWPDFYNGDASEWGRLLDLGHSLGYVILNRSNGVWGAFDQDFATQAQRAVNAGAKRVLFYVKTQYGWASDLAGAAAQNVPNAAQYTIDWICEQVDNCVDQYGELCGGVFLDEFINGWTAEQAAKLGWYRDLLARIRDKHGSRFVIAGNPGANVSNDVLDLDVDVLMTFEGPADRYLADDPSTPVHPDSHRAQDSRRIWHCVHDVTPELTEQVLAKAAYYGVSHVYATDGNLVLGEAGAWMPVGNPYAAAPSDRLIAATRLWALGLEDALTVQAAAETYATAEEVAALRAAVQALQAQH